MIMIRNQSRNKKKYKNECMANTGALIYQMWDHGHLILDFTNTNKQEIFASVPGLLFTYVNKLSLSSGCRLTCDTW